ncbi:MAG TPA: C39 family peptidase, partial [Chloroflexota bacterium]
AQGRPAIISVRFEPGQLRGAPIQSTNGHLIVVRGFTPEGDVVVNDPIAPSAASVRRVYQREDLERVWVHNAGGVVYVLAPRST